MSSAIRSGRIGGSLAFGSKFVVGSIALAWIIAALGCAAGRSARQTPAPSSSDVHLLEALPIAIAGERLVLPIAAVDGPDPRGRAVRAELEDGRQIKAEHHRLYASHYSDRPHWIDEARQWRAAESAGDEPWPAAITIDVLVLDLPADATGLALNIQNAPTPLSWRELPPSAGAPFKDPQVPLALESPAAQSNLLAHLAPAMEDPLQRWRCRLLAERLRHAPNGAFEALTQRIIGGAFQNVALEAMARQIELRWRLALDRVADADPRRAQELTLALTRLAAVDESQVVPAWAPMGATSGLDQLHQDLLNPSLNDAAIVARVDAWLSARRRAIAWVVDDTGAADPSIGLTLPRVRITDLSGRGGIGDAFLDPNRPGPRVTVAPLHFVTVVASGELREQFTRITARLGEWTRALTVAPQPLVARPPGARLFPLYRPWSQSAWLSGAPAPEPLASATAALLRRRTDGQWELHIECKKRSDANASGGHVRIHLGASLHPRAVFRIDPSGYFVNEMEARDEDEPLTRHPIVVQQRTDRWSCAFTIEPEHIEADRYLRVGLERGDDSGSRATWPRPILPWADAPGRAMFDLGDWLGLEQPAIR